MKDVSSRRRDFSAFAYDATPELLRYGLLLTGNRADAEDLVQGALEKVFRRWHHVDQESSPLAYCRMTMARLHIDAWRRFRRFERTHAEIPEQIDPAHATPDRLAAESEALSLLAGLPPRQRTVLAMRYYLGLSEREVADALHISVGTVKSQTARAIAAARTLQAT